MTGYLEKRRRIKAKARAALPNWPDALVVAKYREGMTLVPEHDVLKHLRAELIRRHLPIPQPPFIKTGGAS